jgi:hypothetical protein
MKEAMSCETQSYRMPWTLEVRNIATGELMTTRTSMNRSTSVSTIGWPKGLYAVKVIVDKEELIEKMVIR